MLTKKPIKLLLGATLLIPIMSGAVASEAASPMSACTKLSSLSPSTSKQEINRVWAACNNEQGSLREQFETAKKNFKIAAVPQKNPDFTTSEESAKDSMRRMKEKLNSDTPAPTAGPCVAMGGTMDEAGNCNFSKAQSGGLLDDYPNPGIPSSQQVCLDQGHQLGADGNCLVMDDIDISGIVNR